MELHDPETTRELASEIVSRSYYQLEGPAIAEGAIARFFNMLWQLLAWVIRPLVWIIEWINSLPTVLSVIVTIILILLAIGLLLHIIITLIRAVGRTRRQNHLHLLGKGEELDPDALESQADQAAQNGEALLAIRLLYQACLQRIKQKNKNLIRKGMTNREHLLKLRSTPLHAPVQTFVRTIDLKYYGDESCTDEDLLNCQAAHSQLVSALRGASV